MSNTKGRIPGGSDSLRTVRNSGENSETASKFETNLPGNRRSGDACSAVDRPGDRQGFGTVQRVPARDAGLDHGAGRGTGGTRVYIPRGNAERTARDSFKRPPLLKFGPGGEYTKDVYDPTAGSRLVGRVILFCAVLLAAAVVGMVM